VWRTNQRKREPSDRVRVFWLCCQTNEPHAILLLRHILIAAAQPVSKKLLATNMFYQDNNSEFVSIPFAFVSRRLRGKRLWFCFFSASQQFNI
jgi:hypothetical protein